MSTNREIQDTPADRAALAIILPFMRPPIPLVAETAPAEVLDAAWTSLARDLASADEARIDEILRRVREVGNARAEALMALIIDWRHGTWEAAEIAAGRDPYVTV